jgi:hypothetical protein
MKTVFLLFCIWKQWKKHVKLFLEALLIIDLYNVQQFISKRN